MKSLDGMDLIDRMREVSSRMRARLDKIGTEEATKNALVMPFINHVLGYHVFDPSEVVPEFTADVGTKKGEKVDYALLQDDVPIILFECKRYLSRVEGRRVTGRGSVADPALSHRAAVRSPWARFLPPLSEPGVPVSGTGLSSEIMRLAHGFPGRDERAGRASRGTRLAPLRWSGRCVVRPVDARTTATTRVVPFAYACDDVRHCCSSSGY